MGKSIPNGQPTPRQWNEVRNFIWELCHLSVESGCPSIGVDFRDYLDVEVINAVGWNVLEPEAPGSKAPAGPCHSPVSRTESPKAASFTRSFEEMGVLIEENKTALLSDEELVEMCIRGKVAGYSLEKTLESQSTPAMTRLEAFTRAVKIRRAVVARMPSTLDVSSSLEQARLSYQNYNYELDGISHAFVSVFENIQVRDYFIREDPAHIRLVDAIKQDLYKMQVVDFVDGVLQ
ncbi:hypothetical protein BDV29DRAFT_158511 [Aspergillus leporis]|uniref:Uncharacterized protein n=1 Tax=Aspergillus leporis TaxID=41062 RepID=A0A5N5WVC7_9EURO|nr:hypothetical protein BDV29DRAFT_158511 [Aspergillus leporis]